MYILANPPYTMSSIPSTIAPSFTVSAPEDQSRMTSSTSPPLRQSSPNSSSTNAGRTRSSSLLHKNVLSRMRPLPFQYVYAMWHSKPTSNPTSLTLLSESIPDIASFYRIYNNFPWETGVQQRDAVHFFRAGVKPLWEDTENVDGGCWTVKVKREDKRALRVWEELCLMVLGGELQASIAQERDHILGLSYSPRLYWSHISIWIKKGGNQKSIDMLQRTILSRLSDDLQPKSPTEYYFKKHSEHEGWEDIVKVSPTTDIDDVVP